MDAGLSKVISGPDVVTMDAQTSSASSDVMRTVRQLIILIVRTVIVRASRDNSFLIAWMVRVTTTQHTASVDILLGQSLPRASDGNDLLLRRWGRDDLRDLFAFRDGLIPSSSFGLPVMSRSRCNSMSASNTISVGIYQLASRHK